MFYRWLLAQPEHDQHGLDQPAAIPEPNWLTFTVYKVAVCSTELINFA